MATWRLLEHAVNQKKVPSDKIVRVMGLDAEGMVESCIKDVTVSRTSMSIFWNRLQLQPREAAVYAKSMLERLLEVLKDPSWNSSNVSPQMLSNTLQFILVYIELDRNLAALLNPGLKMLAECEGAYFHHCPALRTIKMMAKLRLSGADAVPHAIVGASTLHTYAEFQELNCGKSLPMLDASM